MMNCTEIAVVFIILEMEVPISHGINLLCGRYLNTFILYTQAHSQDVNCVKWNPKDASLFASCSDDNLIKLWKVADI